MAPKILDKDKTPYVFLGRCGLKVSNLCLGTMTFGTSMFLKSTQCNEELSHKILNRFSEWGGNFIDTADAYGPNDCEEIIGRWLEAQPRDQFVIGTKCRYDMGVDRNINNVGLSRRHITASIEGSLRRLHTDYVDLYQTHLFDEATPLEETLRTLDDLVRAGKIRYIGASNLSGWQLQKMVSTCEHLGLNPVVSLQQQYNLLSRWSELEAFQVCKSAGIGVLPWSPLKGGLLAGKVKRGVKPTEGRMGWAASDTPVQPEVCPPWTTLDDTIFNILETAETIAKKHRRSMGQVAIRWLLQKDVVTSVVIGATTLAQLDDNMAAATGWSLTKDEMKQLDEVSSSPMFYPYNMLAQGNGDRVNRLAGECRVLSLAGSS
ncbi:hypothetical protein BsWGS_21638 [Bradybaena similaris]